MPSSNGTSVAEKLLHTKALFRFALSGFRTDAIWTNAGERELFELFVDRCNREAQLDIAMLFRIHDDELLQLFDAFQMTPWERTVIRSYLNLPEDAIWILWTSLKVGVLSSLAAFRIGRALFGVPGAAFLIAGTGISVVGAQFRSRILSETKKLLEHGRKLAEEQTSSGPRSVLPSRSTISPEVPLSDELDLTSNPFYDPADQGTATQRTPRYSIRSLPPCDFSRHTEDPLACGSAPTAGGSSQYMTTSQPRYFSLFGSNRLSTTRQREVVWEDPASTTTSVSRRDEASQERSAYRATQPSDVEYIPTARDVHYKSSESLPHTEDSFERL